MNVRISSIDKHNQAWIKFSKIGRRLNYMNLKLWFVSIRCSPFVFLPYVRILWCFPYTENRKQQKLTGR